MLKQEEPGLRPVRFERAVDRLHDELLMSSRREQNMLGASDVERFRLLRRVLLRVERTLANGSAEGAPHGAR